MDKNILKTALIRYKRADAFMMRTYTKLFEIIDHEKLCANKKAFLAYIQFLADRQPIDDLIKTLEEEKVFL